MGPCGKTGTIEKCFHEGDFFFFYDMRTNKMKMGNRRKNGALPHRPGTL